MFRVHIGKHAAKPLQLWLSSPSRVVPHCGRRVPSMVSESCGYLPTVSGANSRNRCRLTGTKALPPCTPRKQSVVAAKYRRSSKRATSNNKVRVSTRRMLQAPAKAAQERPARQQVMSPSTTHHTPASPIVLFYHVNAVAAALVSPMSNQSGSTSLSRARPPKALPSQRHSTKGGRQRNSGLALLRFPCHIPPNCGACISAAAQRGPYQHPKIAQQTRKRQHWSQCTTITIDDSTPVFFSALPLTSPLLLPSRSRVPRLSAGAGGSSNTTDGARCEAQVYPRALYSAFAGLLLPLTVR